jgi:PTH2 family peptidyl-tRNA hydrolase
MSIKQVIIIRKDLNMRKGKMVAQGAHASLGAFFEADLILRNRWYEGLATKICVSVNSEQELLDVYKKAMDAKLPCSLIKDAGLTEFKEPTYTAVAIGPAAVEEIDPITKILPLL